MVEDQRILQCLRNCEYFRKFSCWIWMDWRQRFSMLLHQKLLDVYCRDLVPNVLTLTYWWNIGWVFHFLYYIFRFDYSKIKSLNWKLIVIAFIYRLFVSKRVLPPPRFCFIYILVEFFKLILNFVCILFGKFRGICGTLASD